eukprot:gene10589-7357_t
MPPKGPKSVPGKAPAKKTPAAVVAKLKAMMEKQKAEEERIQREIEEEERRVREEERLANEQRRFEEAQQRLEKERQKEEEKLAKKQLAKTVKSEALDRMRASGFIVPDVEKIRQETKNQEKPVYQKPRRPKVATPVFADPNKLQKKEEDKSDSEDEEDNDEALDDGEVTVPTESDAEIEDDWEAQMEREKRREERHKNNIRIREEREKRTKDKEEAKAARKAARKEEKARQKSLRSPISCVLGHVDTGKTSLLDRIRRSNVQAGEAGGITQQIGATFFPAEGLLIATGELREQLDMRVPGLLVIDTPGHESFTNLRSRGSSICDIAILVVDIMHGLENQTRESIRLLREQRCPFLIALNKVDRLYDWEPHENMPIQKTLALQKKHVQSEFQTRTADVLNQLSAEGLNTMLYYKNNDKRKVISIVPTSAHTGEGICDLLMLEIALVQEFMKDKVTLRDDLQCTVLEVQPVQGMGFTIDCILINGELHEGQNICLCGQSGPIYTQIRLLLTPQPMKEMRAKSSFEHHSTIKAAMGIKICANDLEFVVPGTSLVVVDDNMSKEEAAEAVMSDAQRVEEMVSKEGVGVTVMSSTLGALEALLSFLKDMKIPIGYAGIGTIQKRHLYHALSMKRKSPRHAVVLAFDVSIADNANEMADKEEIRIFQANIIYHLFDAFTQARLRDSVIFPVVLTVTGDAFHATKPMIIPVKVKNGQLRTGTPLCTVTGKEGDSNKDGEIKMIGRVMSLERDGKPVEKATPGMEVAVKIYTGDTNASFGRQVDKHSELISRITRPSVNAIKKFRSELTPEDVNLLATLIQVLKGKAVRHMHRLPPPPLSYIPLFRSGEIWTGKKVEWESVCVGWVRVWVYGWVCAHTCLGTKGNESISSFEVYARFLTSFFSSYICIYIYIFFFFALFVASLAHCSCVPFDTSAAFVLWCCPQLSMYDAAGCVSRPLPALDANDIIRACAWSSGDAEFIFGDGTVLAFKDEMNTFVALHPPAPPSTASTASMPWTAGKRDLMCTAWALSAYRPKVSAALRLFNRYMPYPRLLPTLFPAPEEPAPRMCGSSAAICETLLLVRDPALLERRAVSATVRVPAPGASVAFPERDWTAEAVVGTEWTLWCALRRVSLTLHYHEQLFTVRWPAVVPGSPRSSALDNSAELLWLEQVFPVDAPPPAWADMLWLAREMKKEAEEAEAASGGGSGAPPTGNGSSVMNDADTPAGQTVVHRLPRLAITPTVSRFPAYAASDREALVASRDVALAACQSQAHPAPHTRLLWQWTADMVGRDPPAMYWYLAPHGSTAPEGPRGGDPSAAVFGIVREDESVVRVHRLGARAFQVCHRRLDGSRKTYFVDPGGLFPTQLTPPDTAPPASPDGSYVLEDGSPLPGPLGPMRFDRFLSVPTDDERWETSTAATSALPEAPVVVHSEDVLRLTARVIFQDRARPSSPSSPAHGAPGRICSAFPDGVSWGAYGHGHALLSTLPLPRAAGGRGRYLGHVVTHCINLLSLLGAPAQPVAGDPDAAQLAGYAPRTSGDTVSVAASLQRHLHPLMSDREAALAAAVDPTIYRPFLELVEPRHQGTQLGLHDGGSPRSRAYQPSDSCPRPGSESVPDAGDAATPYRPLFESFSTATTRSPPTPRECHAAVRGPPTPPGAEESRDTPCAPLASEAPVAFTSARVEGVGNFTAWRNGTVRCCFDDRTILSLMPGPSSSSSPASEQDLVAHCLFRDATSTVARLAQCGPAHRLFPYVDALLPFRRQVLQELWGEEVPAEVCQGQDTMLTSISLLSGERSYSSLSPPPPQPEHESEAGARRSASQASPSSSVLLSESLAQQLERVERLMKYWRERGGARLHKCMPSSPPPLYTPRPAVCVMAGDRYTHTQEKTSSDPKSATLTRYRLQQLQTALHGASVSSANGAYLFVFVCVCGGSYLWLTLLGCRLFFSLFISLDALLSPLFLYCCASTDNQNRCWWRMSEHSKGTSAAESEASYYPAALYVNVCDAVIGAMAPSPEEAPPELLHPVAAARRGIPATTSSLLSSANNSPSRESSPPAPVPGTAPPPPPRAAWIAGREGSGAAPSLVSRASDLRTLSTWSPERSPPPHEYGLFFTSSRGPSEAVSLQHLPDLIRIPASQVPGMYHQLCNAVWTAVSSESQPSNEPEVAAEVESTTTTTTTDEEAASVVYARSKRMFIRSGEELYNSICDGVWEVLSLGAEPPGMESLLLQMENAIPFPPRPAPLAKGEHLPDLIAIPCASLSSVISSICDGVWEIVSLLSEAQEARLAHFEAERPVGHHLPPLVGAPPPETARTAAPRQRQAPPGCYNVHPVVPEALHSLLGNPRMRQAAIAARGNVNGDGGPPAYGRRQDANRTFLSRPEPLPPPPVVVEGTADLPPRRDDAATEFSDRGSSTVGFSGFTPSEQNTLLSMSLQRPVQEMPYFYRDECVHRERLMWEMVMESLRLFPWPLNPVRREEIAAGLRGEPLEDGTLKSPEALRLEQLQHPALIFGQDYLDGVQHFERKGVIAEEREAMAKILKLYTYEHRVLTVGTLPLETFCRRWIHQFRGRRLLRAKQREVLCKREEAARLELLRTDPTFTARFELMRDSLTFLESRFRLQIELLQLRVAYVTGNVVVRLAEQVNRFPILYGGSMRKTRACARVAGTTVFMRVHLMEQLFRERIEKEERYERYMELPWEAQKRSLVDIFEPPERRAVEVEEAFWRADLEYKLHQLIVHYCTRDVEVYRAVTFDIELARPFASAGVVVDDSALIHATLNHIRVEMNYSIYFSHYFILFLILLFVGWFALCVPLPCTW